MRSLIWLQTVGFGLGGQAGDRKEPAILVGCRGIEVDRGIAREVAIELGEGRREPLTQWVNEGGDLHGLREHAVIGRALRLIMPVRWQILAGIAKGVRPFDPDLFALEGPLELL